MSESDAAASAVDPATDSAALAADDADQADALQEDVPSAQPAVGVAPVVQGDWLASVCPYLASEDGTYRSAAPDEGHRCTVQDPAATLTLAFQERFCLTDRHPRCEMFKFAQETNTSGGIPAAEVQAAATRVSRPASGSGGGVSRPAIAAAAGLGGVAILVFVLVMLVGSCSGDGGAPMDDGSSPDPQATEAPAPAATPEPTPERTAPPTPTREPEVTAEPDPDATPVPESTPDAQGQGVTILYEVQEGEALLRIAETFDITRRRILRANPGLDDIAIADLPGQVIEIPVPATMDLALVEAMEGYQGVAP